MSDNHSDKYDIEKHKEWINYLKPEGLVFAPGALIRADIRIPNSCRLEQNEFINNLERIDYKDENPYGVSNLKSFFKNYLGYTDTQINSSSEVAHFLEEFGETLDASFFIQHDGQIEVLVKEIPLNESFDESYQNSSRGWHASNHSRFERLMREKKITVGIISNGFSIRLIYAPRGETSGFITFPIKAMTEYAGRSIFWAFQELVHSKRLNLYKIEKKDLASILEMSRNYQNDVSIKLSGQVLIALYELLRGLQAADDLSKKDLLKDIPDDELDIIYEGLITVLLRAVFILYVEDRELASTEEFYTRHYSIRGLFNKLRDDHSMYAEGMGQRFGAWGHLISLFRLYHEGAEFKTFKIPARHGYLFDPERFPFLEGRERNDDSNSKEIPGISDRVIWEVLKNLLILDGELISYRTLDVEQIGSVYETLMGFKTGRTQGRSVAIKAANPKKNKVPTIIDVDHLLGITKLADKKKYFLETTGRKLTKIEVEKLKPLKTIEEVRVWLGSKLDDSAIPNYAPVGCLMFYPTEERRNSGSHYTPRDLTSPIVEETLKPLLDQLGANPTAAQILELNVCDPAMGSGAFLVETSRQLGDHLIKAWHFHDDPDLKTVKPGEGEILLARRKIAQRCIYGIDKNPMAVDLAKLSIWLITLSRDEDFSFLDHALKCGDSILGLTNKQITTCSLDMSTMLPIDQYFHNALDEAIFARSEIQDDPRTHSPESLLHSYDVYIKNTHMLKNVGNLIIKAFFDEKKHKARVTKIELHRNMIFKFLKTEDYESVIQYCNNELLMLNSKLVPFHWELEFPEIFTQENSGFDAFVGNPPYMGKNRIIKSNANFYIDWLKFIHQIDVNTANDLEELDIDNDSFDDELREEELDENDDEIEDENEDENIPPSEKKGAHGNSDIVAHFFRRTFNYLRTNGTMGLITTNTIRQGDTRETGLTHICNHGGVIYKALTRKKWPGVAAVVVSVVWIKKGPYLDRKFIDDRPVDKITAFLFHDGGNDSPIRLKANMELSSIGAYVFGDGFLFKSIPKQDNIFPELSSILELEPNSESIIFSYIGGKEVLNDPRHNGFRKVINFGEMSEAEASKFALLFNKVEAEVKPLRLKQKDEALKRNWWRFARTKTELFNTIKQKNMTKILFHPNLSTHLAFTFLDAKTVVGAPHNVFLFENYSSFCVLQSRIHETWARFFSGSFKDDLRYSPSDCFESFPFPQKYEKDQKLEEIGKRYFEHRAALMIEANEGMTKTYNRFHDKSETKHKIIELRKLQEEMDKAVIECYGWDLNLEYEFILDYEEDIEEISTLVDQISTNKKPKKIKKKPYRLKFTQEVHDEILAKLLQLNKERSSEEQANG